MKTKKSTPTTKEFLTQQELIESIKKAEKGPFVSGEKLKAKINKWVNESEK
jgi:hypothetical protein